VSGESDIPNEPDVPTVQKTEDNCRRGRRGRLQVKFFFRISALYIYL